MFVGLSVGPSVHEQVLKSGKTSVQDACVSVGVWIGCGWGLDAPAQALSVGPSVGPSVCEHMLKSGKISVLDACVSVGEGIGGG